ncbi:helix-turn-helix domain-containing protein [Serpentinimonas maccroryi]|uniref:helix-turn-helix domain-containing protein n=1 Tax=Serpentinimonas maccroryi TaxID=1458426 RepID=UPI0020348223|nr:helix-turn-helix domain-containing protein [Serpentinimonas maccroryi]
MTLRQARERTGLRVEALAATLKVPVRQLEALEAGRYDELPDPTFARALASSVCRVLKTDPGPILASLPALARVRLGEPENALHTPLPSATASTVLARAASAPIQRLSAPVAVALFLLVAALTLWFLLPRQAPEPAPAGAEPQLATQQAPQAAQPDVPKLTPTPAPAPAASPVLRPSPVLAPLPAPAAPAAPAAPTAASAPLLAPATQPEVLRLSADQTAWVQVIGASGRVLLQRSLQPGESVVFNDDLPLQLVIGRADAVRVNVRGAAADLNALSRNNVARLQVR